MTHLAYASSISQKQPIKQHALTCYGRREYFATLTEQLKKCASGDRAILMAMTFDPHPTELRSLAEAMCTAVSQGAEVHFIVDAYVFLTNDYGNLGPLIFRQELGEHRLPKWYASIYAKLEYLRTHGVQCHITNMPARRFSNPFAGRSHIKCALINDYVYIGGCNFDHPEHADMMVGWEDSTTATWLHTFLERIIANGRIRKALGTTDITRPIDATTTIFIDVGVRGQSQILAQALDVVDHAKTSLYLTTQYFPNGKMAQHLKHALERGVKVVIIYNHIDKNESLKVVHKLNFLHKRRRLPGTLFAHELPKESPYVHAKILASEKEVIVGSHNYVTPGVRFGTAEIALHRRDPAFAAHVVKEFQTYI